MYVDPSTQTNSGPLDFLKEIVGLAGNIKQTFDPVESREQIQSITDAVSPEQEKKNYLPWIIGGVGAVTGITLLILVLKD